MGKTLADLSNAEFKQALEAMSVPEYDAVTADEFFHILSAMDTADEIHLVGHPENEHLVFEKP